MLLARRRMHQKEKELAQARRAARAAEQNKGAPASSSPSSDDPGDDGASKAPRPKKGMNKTELALFALENFEVELNPGDYKADALFEAVEKLADEADAK